LLRYVTLRTLCSRDALAGHVILFTFIFDLKEPSKCLIFVTEWLWHFVGPNCQLVVPFLVSGVS